MLPCPAGVTFPLRKGSRVLSSRAAASAAARPYSGTEAALEAARLGDLKTANQLELAWRNAWRIVPHELPEHVEAALNGGHSLQLLAYDIEHCAGPHCETLICWMLVHACPRCWRRQSARKNCRTCHGFGYTDDIDYFNGDLEFAFRADLDGNLIEAQW